MREKNRLCIDFRDLNKLLVPEGQPFPLIEDIILKTRNCNWFSTFDINSTFWSIPIRSKDRYKTGFVTQQGHWQWCSLPFGLKTAPAIFQRILYGIIHKNKLTDFCMNYIDDILIFSSSFDEHLNHIRKLLEAIRKEGFKLKFVKCIFASHKIKYLGHIIENNTVRPLNDNLISIRNFPIPKTKKNIRQFLGKINFYNKYIRNATQTLEPFHNLLRKNTEFLWTPQCQQSFEQIKEYLTSSPTLAIFNPTLKTSLYTDASIEGLGAILKQTQNNGEEKPVAYFSRKLNENQKKKKAIFLECLAIREAIKYWRFWLLGNKFTVFTDYKPLKNFRVKVRPDEELGNLLTQISQFDFDIKYKPSNTNLEADCLSRNPVLEYETDTTKILRTVNVLTLEEIQKDQAKLQNPNNFTINNNIFYKKNTNRIILTESTGKKLIQQLHETLGHIGEKHLINSIRPYYYFKYMDKNISIVTKSCEICIKNKSRTGKKIGLLSYLGPATKPFDIMSLDTIGGFGGRRSTKKFLHLLVDHFTRFAYISTSSTQNASDFIKLLDTINENNNINTLLTDQYGAFLSADFENYIINKGINHILTAVDNPESNGLNERLNQTIVNRLRCKINTKDEKRTWSTLARECIKEYNNTIHSITKFSPRYLMDGIEFSITPSELRENVTPLHSARNLALENSIKNHEQNKKRIDKNRKENTLHENDLVFVENGNKLNRKKLDEIRIGPFPIVQRISDSIYLVKCGDSRKQLRQFHISKIQPLEYKNS